MAKMIHFNSNQVVVYVAASLCRIVAILFLKSNYKLETFNERFTICVVSAFPMLFYNGITGH